VPLPGGHRPLCHGYEAGLTRANLNPHTGPSHKDPCPCGSGKLFIDCHGACDVPPHGASVGQDRPLTHGYWLVAFLDLLGQKEAFLRTDYLPNAADAEKVEQFLSEVRASTGVILGMRKILSSFRTGMATANTGLFDDLDPAQRQVAERLQRTRVREFRMSDGVVLACALMPEDGHFPMRAVYEVIATCSVLLAVQLAAGRPIRGGIDVGTGIEVEGELFGASLVKAYLLESKRAKYPRLVVGQDLVNYLRASTKSPLDGVEGQVERSMAEGMLRLLARDFDEQWIVDYAGAQAQEMLPALLDMLGPAKAFAERSRAELTQRQDEEGQKLFDRYSTLVRYLDGAGVRGVKPTEQS
jgi:hypothetical protein